MLRRLSLRTRLTVTVTVVFAVALTVTAVFTRIAVESALRDVARESAVALLADYVKTLDGGAIGLADTDDAATRFLYLVPGGGEITDDEYARLLFDALDELLDEQVGVQDPASSLGLLEPSDPDTDFIEVDAALVEVVGPAEDIDRGDDVIAVGVPLRIGDTRLTVAVSTPVRAVEDSVAALTGLGLAALAALTAVIAAITWFAVSRALAPVQAISNQADRISAASLDQRLPQPATSGEIAHLAATMNRMLDRLERSSLAQRQFVSDASHELRSPVTATLLSLETADSAPAASDWAELRTTLTREQYRLAQLIDGLLLLAQLDEGAAPKTDANVDLDEIALAEASRPRPVPVDVRVDEPARVSGNAKLLEHCARNLIDNAARHAVSRVEVTISRRDRHAVLVVEDDGLGVPEAERARIFDRFARLDDARTRRDGGAGLGLAIVKRIVTQHHGTIECGTSPSGGARFTVTLPAELPPESVDA